MNTDADVAAPFAVAARGAVLLGVGQGILVGGLAVFGLVRTLLDPVRPDTPPWTVLLALGGTAGLLAVFVAGVLRHRHLAWARSGLRPGWGLGLLAIAAALVLVSPHFVWLQFPVWMVAAQALSLPIALPAIAASLAVSIGVLLRSDPSSAGVIGPIVGALVAVGLARGVLRLMAEARRSRELLARVVEAQAEAAALSDEVVRAQREAGVLQERARLARDIHDTLAQGFSSIVLLARAAQRTPDAGRAAALVAEIEATASGNLTEARRVVYALDPPGLAADGLAAPLRRLGDDLARQGGVAVTVEVADDAPRLPAPDEVALLRAAQGALANVRRHARASAVAITLTVGEGVARLDVVDDGVGFDQAAATASEPTLAGGYGLRALRARLGELGGGLAVESEPGSGTAVSAWVPLRGAA